jgi:hypothetical protein
MILKGTQRCEHPSLPNKQTTFLVSRLASMSSSIALSLLRKMTMSSTVRMIPSRDWRSLTTTTTTGPGDSDDGQINTDRPSSPVGSTLSRQVLKSIKKDLVAADVNDDGCIDFEELKSLLHKYKDRVPWTDDEIDNIGDLFFVGSGGRGIKHITFLRGLQYSVCQKPPEHNPLGLKSLSDDRCWTAQSTACNNAALHLIQAEFDKQLLKYIESKLAYPDSDISEKKE